MASQGDDKGTGSSAAAPTGWRALLQSVPARIVALVVGIPAFAAGLAYLFPIIPAIVRVKVECDDRNVVVRIYNYGGRVADLGTPRVELRSRMRTPENPEAFEPFLSDLPSPVNDSNRRLAHFSSDRYPYSSPYPLFDPSELASGVTVRVTVPYNQALGSNNSRTGEAQCVPSSS